MRRLKAIPLLDYGPIVRRHKSSTAKHRRDTDRGIFISERITKHVEIYRLLHSEPTRWFTSIEVAEHCGMSRKHARRLLYAFSVAGYIEVIDGYRGQEPTVARLKAAALTQVIFKKGRSE